MTIDSCDFTGNVAGVDSSGGGGAVYLSNCTTTLLHCNLTDNASNWVGGAAVVAGGQATFVDCLLGDNDADSSGGAVYASGEAIVNVWSSTVQNNVSSSIGGGVRVINGCELEINDSVFFNNAAATHGGGIAVSNFSDATIERSRFESNSTERGGATFSDNDDSSLTVRDTVFVANIATVYGGASYVAYQATFTNCTYYNNSAPAGRGSAYEAAGGGSQIATRNSIVVGAMPTKTGAGSMSFKYCNLPDAPNGGGNISTDPLFVNAFGGDYHLAAGSPCIDAGDTTYVLAGHPKDADNNPRAADDPDTSDTGYTLLGLTVDMGAYEVQPDAQTCQADTNGDGQLNILDFVAFQGLFQAGCP